MTVDTLRQACFFNKIKFWGLHAVGTSTREDSRPVLSIHVSIITVRLTL